MMKEPKRAKTSVRPLSDGTPLAGESDLEQLAGRANRHHSLAGKHAKNALAAYHAAGEALIQAKRQLAHGKFQEWVATNCNFSMTTARRYMSVASNWETIEPHLARPKSLVDLSLRGVEELIGKGRATRRPTRSVAKTGKPIDESEVPAGTSTDPAAQAAELAKKCGTTTELVTQYRKLITSTMVDHEPQRNAFEQMCRIRGSVEKLYESLEKLLQVIGDRPAPSPPRPATDQQTSATQTATPVKPSASQREKRSPRQRSRPIETPRRGGNSLRR